MDLSQQELPLTSFFASKPRPNTRKKNKLTDEDPSSEARPSKRTRNNARRSVPQGLPTPIASVRKRARDTVESPQLDVLSPAILSAEKSLAPPTPSTLPRSPCSGAIAGVPSTSLATPSTGRRKTTHHIEREPTLSTHMETGIATPQTSSRRVSVPMYRADHTPSTPSSCLLLSKPNSASRDNVFVLPPKRMEGQPSRGLPMFPVSSSQSQYLLPIDATPKRKQRPQRMEHVISSQSQEERDLTLSPSLRPLTMFGLSIEHTPRKSGNVKTPRISPRRRNSQHVRILGHSPVRSPVNAPSTPSRSFEKKKADELSSESLGSPRRKKSMPCHSPSHKKRTPRIITRQVSIENIPPAHIEDSLTEPESDPDGAQVPSRLLAVSCTPVNRESKLPIVEDDSATEAESDTEILRCVAEIGKKRRPEISRQESPPAPVISPLVSPISSRVAPMPARPSGVKSSVSGSSTSYRSTMQQPCTGSDFLPSAVRDFIHMFPGDESYPADFPESLRV